MELYSLCGIVIARHFGIALSVSHDILRVKNVAHTLEETLYLAPILSVGVGEIVLHQFLKGKGDIKLLSRENVIGKARGEIGALTSVLNQALEAIGSVAANVLMQKP